MTQARWRRLDGAHLLPLVRAGIAFVWTAPSGTGAARLCGDPPTVPPLTRCLRPSPKRHPVAGTAYLVILGLLAFKPLPEPGDESSRAAIHIGGGDTDR